MNSHEGKVANHITPENERMARIQEASNVLQKISFRGQDSRLNTLSHAQVLACVFELFPSIDKTEAARILGEVWTRPGEAFSSYNPINETDTQNILKDLARRLARIASGMNYNMSPQENNPHVHPSASWAEQSFKPQEGPEKFQERLEPLYELLELALNNRACTAKNPERESRDLTSYEKPPLVHFITEAYIPPQSDKYKNPLQSVARFFSESGIAIDKDTWDSSIKEQLAQLKQRYETLVKKIPNANYAMMLRVDLLDFNEGTIYRDTDTRMINHTIQRISRILDFYETQHDSSLQKGNTE